MSLDKIKVKRFVSWLEQCPVDYDEIQETIDDNTISINFHGKDIYKTTINEKCDCDKCKGIIW